MSASAPVRTTCPYCGVGCGVLATPRADGGVDIAGDSTHGANLGRLCVKGSALGETVGLEDRLLYPEIAAAPLPLAGRGWGRGKPTEPDASALEAPPSPDLASHDPMHGSWRSAGRSGAPPSSASPPQGVGGLKARRRASWDEALDTVAQGFARIIAEHGPDAVAFYVSGQLLTEDYYLANKLMKGYIGSANIDTNSRLCMSSAVAGHKRAFGEDLVPGCYEDFEQADLVVLVGANTAWCHPVLYQRLSAAKQARPELQVVVIDPRRTSTCELADLHLPLAPGSDVRLFNGLLAWLHQHGHGDADYLAAHTEGAEAAVAAALASAGTLAEVAAHCRLEPEPLERFYRLWAGRPNVVTAFSQGVNQSSSGSDKVNAIINCHLYTGRIGKPGASPFSITGQPNAMGGREVGGLANQLAAHLELEDPAHRALVQDYWRSPRIAARPGLKAVELFEAIHAGAVKAVWIVATNPVVSLPDADRVRAALQRCELVVVSELMARGDTADLAHVLLPATGWGEKDGTVTNSDRRISRQRAFLPAPGAARPDWWMFAEVGRRMGYSGFAQGSAHEIFVEHAGLSGYRNTGTGDWGLGTGDCIPRVFNLAGLAGLSADQYEHLQPLQWPVPQPPTPGPQSPVSSQRLFADGRYAHPDGRARLLALSPRPPANAPDADWPLVLNSGRVRDHWHTMTRTGKAPRLAEHLPEPYVELHPEEALHWGLREGELARVESRWGACVLRVRASTGIARGQLFVPIHWNGRTASDARIGALVNPVVDPISGEPEFKHTPARLAAFPVDWQGFALSRRPLPEASLRGLPLLSWWTRIQGREFLRYELAGRGRPADWSDWTRQLLGLSASEPDWLDASDPAEGRYHAALVEDERLAACLFLSPRADELPTRRWLSSLFAQPRLAEAERAALLAGQPLDAGSDPGPTVCSCFGVGRNPITAAIRAGCDSPEALGQQLRCGSNCGSCIPELRQLITAVRAETR